MKDIKSIDRREAVKKMALIMGVSATAPMITSLLHSCDSPTTIDWLPRSLSDKQANTLTAMADFIIPETSTPGAKSLGVPQFIDGMITDIMSEEKRLEFMLEIDGLLATCMTKMNKPFEECTDEEKAQFLTYLEGDNKEGRPSVWGTTMIKSPKVNFFWKIKELIISGYYLNEEVGERILAYDPVPGQFLDCIPVSQVGKVWSL